jgi:serine/threonine-protein kinase
VLAERYTVLTCLGHGGMSVVLAAYDTRLNRRVALKLLRPRWSQEGCSSQMRLLREAQAMAQLNHPQVVHVYDSGRLEDDSVFIAMEYVEGQTLRQWLEQRPRSWREVLRAFLEAGQGLSAAHQAGLVHRDFKPDNVLVGLDGRVRVTDFGLALARNTLDSGPQPEPRPLPSTWDEPLTVSGMVLGTPRYMAPEQLRGQPVDARSDLFAFCVSLYEALYGQRPFPGENPAELTQAREEERIQPPPAQTDVPAWLGRVVRRGLRADPRRRPASLARLLEELQHDPEQRRWAWVRAAGLTAGMGLMLTLTAWTWVRQQELGPACGHMSRRLTGIWDDTVKRRVEQALVGTGRPYARDTFERTSWLLDAYAEEWVKRRTEACALAREERATEPQRLAVRREYCLERRLSQLGALTELLAHPSAPEQAEKAVQAVQALSFLSECSDAGVLTATVPLPEDLALRPQAEALEQQIDRLQAFHRTGQYRQGLAVAKTLWPQLTALDHPPLRARALYWRAALQEGAGDYTGAEDSLREALVLAAKVPVLEARLWSLLVTVVGARQARYTEALWLELPLRAAAERVGDDYHLALAHESLGNVRWMMGRHEEAREHYAHALALLEKSRGAENLDMARLHTSMGNILMDLSRYEQARESYERSLALTRKLLGARHPSNAQTLKKLELLQRTGVNGSIVR